MSLKAKTKNGKKNEEDEVENLEEEDNEDNNEQDLDAQFFSVGRADTWKVGGPKKDIAIRGLIQCFGSMIESIPSASALPDHQGRYRFEDMTHRKLLDASKQVLRAKRYLPVICYRCLSSNLILSLSVFCSTTRTSKPETSPSSSPRRTGLGASFALSLNFVQKMILP